VADLTLIETLEQELLGLLKGEHSSLSLTLNDENALNYQSVREWLEYEDDRDDGWVSPEERERAVATNRMWSLQWYPTTPIGFNRLRASTLSSLLAGLKQP
jgi:hypothetical protein